jgi:hypothetical protein
MVQYRTGWPVYQVQTVLYAGDSPKADATFTTIPRMPVPIGPPPGGPDRLGLAPGLNIIWNAITLVPPGTETAG